MNETKRTWDSKITAAGRCIRNHSAGVLRGEADGFYEGSSMYVWSVLELDKQKKNRSKNTVVGTGCLHRTGQTDTYGGFVEGRIFTDRQNPLCVPWSELLLLSGRLGSRPIGSLQAVLGSRNYRFSFYIFGFLVLVGSLFGRLVCGWLCPFWAGSGPYLIKSLCEKWKNLPGHRVLVWAKYVILLVFL